MGNQSSLGSYSPSLSRSRTKSKNKVYVSYFDPARGVVDMSVPMSADVEAQLVLHCMVEHKKLHAASAGQHNSTRGTSTKTQSRTMNDEFELSEIKYTEWKPSDMSCTESPR